MSCNPDSMNDDNDNELARLKAKRFEEMKKNVAILEKNRSSSKESSDVTRSPKEILTSKLGYRGLEVLDNALYQFPTETNMIVTKLAELISSGEINEIIDGGQLLAIFRAVGLNVRVNTTINVEQDGKFVSLSDKLHESSKSNNGSKNNNG